MSQGQSGNGASAGAGSDAEFVRKAASGGMMEVELGKLAQQKGSSSRVKQIGKTLERDHSKANNELKKVASSQGMTVPDQMEAEHRSHVDQLRNLSGQEFDQQFLQMQAEHHRKDISEFQQEANQGQSSRVKDFANKQLPVLQRHLSMIESNQGSAAREGTSGTDSNRGMSGRSGTDSTTGHGTSGHGTSGHGTSGHGTSDQGTSTSGQGTSTGGQRDQTKDR